MRTPAFGQTLKESLVDCDDLAALIGATGGADAVRELSGAALGADAGLHGLDLGVRGTTRTSLHTAGFTLGNCHRVPLLKLAPPPGRANCSLHGC